MSDIRHPGTDQPHTEPVGENRRPIALVAVVVGLLVALAVMFVIAVVINT